MSFLSSLFGKRDNTTLISAIQQGAYLVDVRTGGEFASGSVNGAVNIPLNELSSNLEKLKGENKIVVFCRSGIRSGQAKGFLEKNGFEVLNGGTWQNVKKCVESI